MKLNQDKLIRVLFLIKRCRDKGKIGLALKLIDKYDITLMSEAYYD